MVLSAFSSSADDTRLVRHGETVYKVKVVFAGKAPGELEKEARSSFPGELEEVLRAVLFMVEHQDLADLGKKIQTQHFLVAPSLKVWKTGQMLGFRQHGKELKVYRSVIFLKVVSRGQHRRKGAPQSAAAAATAAPSLQGSGCGEERASGGRVRRSTSASAPASASTSTSAATSTSASTSTSARGNQCDKDTGVADPVRGPDPGRGRGRGEQRVLQSSRTASASGQTSAVSGHGNPGSPRVEPGEGALASHTAVGVSGHGNPGSPRVEPGEGALASHTAVGVPRVRKGARPLARDTAAASSQSSAAQHTGPHSHREKDAAPSAAQHTGPHSHREKDAAPSAAQHTGPHSHREKDAAPSGITPKQGHGSPPEVRGAEEDAVPKSSPGGDGGRPRKARQPEGGSGHASPGRTRSGLGAETGQQQSPRGTSAGSDSGHNLRQAGRNSSQFSGHNSRQAGRNSSQSPLHPAGVWLRDRNNSSSSLSKQDSHTSAVSSDRGSHSQKAVSRPERDSHTSAISSDGGSHSQKAVSRLERSTQRRTEQVNVDKSRAKETTTRARSPDGRSRTRQPIVTFAVSDTTRQKTREAASLFRSTRLLPKSSRSRQQQQQQQQHEQQGQGQPLHKARSPRRSRSPEGRFDLRRSVRLARITLTAVRQESESRLTGRYELRETIQHSMLREEKRLDHLASDSFSSLEESDRRASPLRVPRTFEQKDRHVVEMGDRGEEQKLQSLASGQDLPRDGTPKPRGTKRHSGLLEKWTGGIVAPLKRALRGRSDTK